MTNDSIHNKVQAGVTFFLRWAQCRPLFVSLLAVGLVVVFLGIKRNVELRLDKCLQLAEE